ncbi:hypothetical protein Tco_0937335 [Tanacetum coccineum]|uniref:Integrase, catalytic region, zinc finger, CCHC-type, peptidase aspartic, catalytic n=1 Tax=Tanacetum coccineum TaxID=301880 RepID=A0ABQ5DE03_9ASTR
MIHFRLPKLRSTRLTPPVPVPTTEKADEVILQDTLQVSLAEHKSREEQEASENVELVNKHLASEEIEKLVEGSENVIDDSLPPRIDEPQIHGTRSLRTHTNLVSSDTEKLQELMVTDTQTTSSSSSHNTKLSKTNRLLSLFKAKPARFKRYKNFFQELQGRYTYLFGHLKKRFLSRKSFDTLADHLQEVMVKSLPIMVDTHIKEQVKKQVPEQVRDQVLVYVAEGLILERQKTKEEMEQMIAKAILQECGNIQAEISSQIQKAIDNQIPSQVDASLQQQDIAIWLALQMKFENLSSTTNTKTSEYEVYVSGESLSRQVNEEERGPSTSGNQEQEDDYDFWIDSYASDDDEIPSKQVSQDIMKEVSLTIEEAKLKKMADEMLRQRCTIRDEHQYHIDQMKNFLKSDIVWESRKEILKGSSGPKKIVLSLHKFLVIIFNDDDIEERTSRWVNKYVKKFNPYARYGVKHWKNPHAKIFYIRKQKDPGNPKEENSKKEKRMKRHSEIHKFCDATLNRVLEGLKSYNNDVKYGYVQRELTNDEVEYLKLFEEEIEIVQLFLFIIDSGCTKHMTGNLKLLCNFVEKYIDLEVTFRKYTCFVRDVQGNDLVIGNRGSDLYTISLQETTSPTPLCLMAKASPTQAWL